MKSGVSSFTTNLRFSDWPTIFPNAATVTALIDRVVHHAEILTIEGRQLQTSGD
jgi:DNA replication protein DnaC